MTERRTFCGMLERDAKTGEWRGEVPEVPGVYAVGRDLAEVRAKLLQQLRIRIHDAEIEFEISW
jgi:predicted RNase H-like HicB family nuclease